MVAHNSYRGVVIEQRDFISKGDIAKEPDKNGYSSRRKALFLAPACTKRDSIQFRISLLLFTGFGFLRYKLFQFPAVGTQ